MFVYNQQIKYKQQDLYFVITLLSYRPLTDTFYVLVEEPTYVTTILTRAYIEYCIRHSEE